MIEAFPGKFEITCPFCEKYCHRTKEQIRELQVRSLKDEDDEELCSSIICDDCWKMVQAFVKAVPA